MFLGLKKKRPTGRLALTGSGYVRYTLKSPYRDGTTYANLPAPRILGARFNWRFGL